MERSAVPAGFWQIGLVITLGKVKMMNTGKTLLVLNAFLLVLIMATPLRAGLATGSSSFNSRAPFSDKEYIYDLTAGYADELCFLVIDNVSDHIAALQSGDIDLIGSMERTPFEDLHGDPGIEMNTTLRNGFGFLHFNCGRYPVNCTELRRAFAYALDKYELQERAWNNYSVPIDSPIISTWGEWSLDDQPWAKENNYYGADPVKGNQILDAHGWNDTDGDGWREDPSGNPVEIELLAGTLAVMYECLLMANETFESIGIRAVIDQDAENYSTRVAQGDYMIYGTAWPAWNYRGSLEFLGRFQTGNAFNWSNATYDALVDTVLTSTNITRIKQACWDAQKILWHELPMVTLYQNLLFSYYRNNRWTGHINAKWGASEFMGGVYSDWNFLKVHLKPEHGQGSGEQYTNWKQGGRFNISVLYARSYLVLENYTNPLVWAFPNAKTSTHTDGILGLVYDQLCRRNPYTAEFCPWLAKDWELEELNDTYPDFAVDHPRARPGDRLKIAYYLHEGLVFHDGYPLTAEDVAYSFDLINRTGMDFTVDQYRPVTHVEVVNETTVEFYCSTTSIFNFIATNSFPVFPKHVWVNVKDPLTWENPYPIGSGPYRWKYQDGNMIILKRNDDFIYNPRNYNWSGQPGPATTTSPTTVISTTTTTPSPVSGFTLAAVVTVAVTAFLARRKGKK